MEKNCRTSTQAGTDTRNKNCECEAKHCVAGPELCGPWPVRMVKTPERCVDGRTSENRVDGESSDGCVALGPCGCRDTDKCVDGGTSGNRVDEGSSDGRVALGRMKTHEIVSIPSDMMMNVACGFPSDPDDR